MAASLPPIYFPLFWPYVMIYFLFMRVVGKISWSRTLVALLTGVAYIFCWMNGVSSTSRIITHGAPIFVSGAAAALPGDDRLGCGDGRHDHEARRRGCGCVGLVAGATELVVGIPLAIDTAHSWALLAVRAGADRLPDPAGPVRVAGVLGEAGRGCLGGLCLTRFDPPHAPARIANLSSLVVDPISCGGRSSPQVTKENAHDAALDNLFLLATGLVAIYLL